MELNDIDIQERVNHYFLTEHFGCSQVVLLVAQELVGRRDDEAVRMVSGYAGGVGRVGSVCGALLGGVAALSLVYRGRGTGQGEKDDPRLKRMCGELYRRFGEEIETSQFCRDITGVDLTNKEGLEAYYNSPEKRARCARLVVKTTEMVRDMFVREATEPLTEF